LKAPQAGKRAFDEKKAPKPAKRGEKKTRSLDERCRRRPRRRSSAGTLAPVRDWIRAALTKKDRNACSPRLFAIVITESRSMHHKSIEEISKRMAGIDIAILSTHTEGGQIANRPMSNNGDVEYDGTSYYFTFEQARTVADIQANPKVALGFTGEGGIFSDAIYVAIEGNAELIRDKTIFKAHWTSDLDRWFDKGVDTPNIVLIKVKANRITYWDGEEEGEVQV
jgi:general stress protein 26